MDWHGHCSVPVEARGERRNAVRRDGELSRTTLKEVTREVIRLTQVAGEK